MQANLNSSLQHSNADGDFEQELPLASFDLNKDVCVDPITGSALEGTDTLDDPYDENPTVLRARAALAEARKALEEVDISASKKLDTTENYRSWGVSERFTSGRLPQRRKSDTPLAKSFQFLSSICAVIGGVLVSSNTSASKYGFIFLACSSSQIFLSSFILKDKALMIYGASLFIFVDCFGIYRWLLQ